MYHLVENLDFQPHSQYIFWFYDLYLDDLVYSTNSLQTNNRVNMQNHQTLYLTSNQSRLLPNQ
ncbi:Uncharacterised protein [Chlamydia trachomatis]|nr:Uncharacterised protein [Chlamydia trachomatis]